MNSNQVANLNLCQELYKLSGWKEDYPEMQWTTVHKPAKSKHMNEEYIPRYDLGYLLRKLPIQVQLYKGLKGYTVRRTKSNYGQTDFQPYVADTPEDAACKLAIELIKQGEANGLVENEPLASKDVAKKPPTAPTSVNREEE